MVNLRFVRGQLSTTRQQSIIFILCVALSIVTLVALRGFGDSINRVVLINAKELVGGDLVIRSNYALSEPVVELATSMSAAGEVEQARLYQFYSMVRSVENDSSLLANIKVVPPAYPLYGRVVLGSGKELGAQLQPGNVVADPTLLERMGRAVGDEIRVGEMTLRVADVVLHEPDRPVNFFTLGPRLFVAAGDLDALQLVKPGSRVTYKLLIQTSGEGDVDALAEQFEAVADAGLESVQTYRTDQSTIQRFYDNFLFFLGMVGIFTLLLAGIGIQSALVAYLRERRTTIAVIRTLGATRSFIYANFFVVVAILGLLGTLIGLAVGIGMQWMLPVLLGDLLPPDITLTISVRAVLESLVLGAFVVGMFTFLPLYQLEELRPSYIFRKESQPIRRPWQYALFIGMILLFFGGMVLWQLRRVGTGLYFFAGVVGLVLIAGVLTEGALWFLGKQRVGALDGRQALRGLFRPGNATRSIIIALSVSLGVLFCIYLVERNLDTSLIRSYPEDAPNFYFIDIQPEQRDAFEEVLEHEATYYPLVRATLSLINGERPLEDTQRSDGRDTQYGLSYRDTLLQGESIKRGGSLFDDNINGAQVSVMDNVQEFTSIEVGDRLTFRVQGVPLEATVASVRSNTDDSVEPLFAFILRPEDLRGVPQTIWAGMRLRPEEIVPVQNRIVAEFPNVNAVDVTATLASLRAISLRLSRVIRFFTAFSIFAGILIIISSIYATRFARMQEAAYYKVLGATSRFVWKVFTLENLLLGLISGALGLLMAQVGSWIIDTNVLELDHRPFVPASIVLVLVTLLTVTTIGMSASVSILRRRPITYLREHSEDE